ncbi:GNAT family N-acetyltransferase [Viridibacillus sp. YIM B01967]|uniref:GNAT family N-acetyltransferase n=1 Tax=Viridibacillus soli TaxID=2798301 RepID=A0ABS1HDF3_9BACL|nr:GNAT family N-acetyltransferase [Viridibacillus soli]MBK3497440.1 GNAT family N-acetyltransferase [Viridibacillus soli]
MMITVRNAKLADGKYVVPLIIDAIGDIANRMTGESEPNAIVSELIHLFERTDNRHSHLNTYVAEQNGKVVGTLVLYSGDAATKMDANLEAWLQKKGAETPKVDKEAHEDEYYVDTVCINPEFRGQGIGTILLKFSEQVAREKGYKKLSLNVENEKEKARHLYERMGFVITEPWTIIDEPFHHMVKPL